MTSKTAFTLVACATALALAAPQTSRATPIIFDTFNTSLGHFNGAVTYSGSTYGIAASSAAVWDTTAGGPIEGSGQLKLTLNAATVGSAMQCRFLSGLGTAANNIIFTTSSGTDGWIGCYIKTDPTTDTNWTVQLFIKPTVAANGYNGGVPKGVIADGQWHLYEWNLDDVSGGPDGWGTIQDVIAGSATVTDSSHFIDSFIFRNTTGPATNVFYMDFVAKTDSGSISNLLATPCLKTSGVLVSGPVSADINQVLVAGVVSNATAVTVYQNTGPSGAMVPIGSLTNGIVAGNDSVTVSGLIKGAQVAATQTANGQESCLTPTGIQVGGGANPRIRISAGIRQDSTAAGPIGAQGPITSANIYWLRATGRTSGLAPLGGQMLTPSTNWQTVIFSATDPAFTFNASPTLPDTNPFGVLDDLSFAMDDLSDTGPFRIYLDNIRNGSTMIQDFENRATGLQNVLFLNPTYSGSSSGNLLTAPDSSTVTGTNAAYGSNACVVFWEFNGTSADKWVRLVAAGGQTNANGSTNFLMVDLTQPIAVDVLILPVGQTNAHSVGLLNISGMVGQMVCPGGSATLNVSVTPPAGTSPTYTYQWQFNGTNISGATRSSFTTNNASYASGGLYSVVVSDGIGANIASTLLSVYPSIQIDTQPTPASAPFTVGSQLNVVGGASAPGSSCTMPAIKYQWLFNGVPIPGASGDAASGVSYTKNNAQIADAGYYSFVASNIYQTVTSAPCRVYVADPASQVFGSGNGLLGYYYSNHLASAPFTGSAATTNTDYGINFDWGTGSPDVWNNPTVVGSDHFTVRWLGKIQGEWNQTYTLWTTNDDGIRVWVNGNLVIDNWSDQLAAAGHSGTVALTTNLSPIVVEYYDNTSSAVAELFWESASQVFEPIPGNQFYSVPTDYPGTPAVVLTSPTNNAQFTMPATINLAASVTANYNGITKVQFYRDSTLIGEVAKAPYTYAWTNAVGGSFAVTARALYNDTASQVNSAAANITVHGATPVSGVTIATATGGNVAIGYSGGAGSRFVLLKSTKVVTPVSNWLRIATNTVTPGIFTVPMGTDPASFYRIQSE